MHKRCLHIYKQPSIGSVMLGLKELDDGEDDELVAGCMHRPYWVHPLPVPGQVLHKGYRPLQGAHCTGTQQAALNWWQDLLVGCAKEGKKSPCGSVSCVGHFFKRLWRRLPARPPQWLPEMEAASNLRLGIQLTDSIWSGMS